MADTSIPFGGFANVRTDKDGNPLFDENVIFVRSKMHGVIRGYDQFWIPIPWYYAFLEEYPDLEVMARILTTEEVLERLKCYFSGFSMADKQIAT